MGGSRFGKDSVFRGSDGDGEWSGLSGEVGIFSVDGGYSTSSGELVGLLESTESIFRSLD